MNNEFQQVCVWPGCMVGKENVEEFEAYIAKEMGVRVKYIEEILTGPDLEDGEPVPETGGRNDLFFYIHSEDISKFAHPSRLQLGIRWVEDVLARCNYHSPIYPLRVYEYVGWNQENIDMPVQQAVAQSDSAGNYRKKI